jgi:hypothetical protein
VIVKRKTKFSAKKKSRGKRSAVKNIGLACCGIQTKCSLYYIFTQYIIYLTGHTDAKIIFETNTIIVLERGAFLHMGKVRYQIRK